MTSAALNKERVRDRIRHLVKLTAKECKVCNAYICFVGTPSGKRIPVDADKLLDHPDNFILYNQDDIEVKGGVQKHECSTYSSAIGFGADVEIPDPDEPGFEPFDRSEGSDFGSFLRRRHGLA